MLLCIVLNNALTTITPSTTTITDNTFKEGFVLF